MATSAISLVTVVVMGETGETGDVEEMGGFASGGWVHVEGGSKCQPRVRLHPNARLFHFQVDSIR